MIVFSKLTFKNFLSVGNNPVTINLNQDKTTLIYGTNGSGKSTILDAICYALFNKPFRVINLPQLVNASNKKDTLVEIDFSIGNTKFTVARGMKPKKFMIFRDGEELEAHAADKDNQKYLEQNILKMNLKTFIQVVILGSGNYMPFMQLNAPSRRDCIEDFLDIKVFSTMALLAKERLKMLKDGLRTCKGDMSNLTYKMDLQRERISEVEARSVTDEKDLNSNIQSDEAEKVRLLEEVTKLQGIDSQLIKRVTELMVSSPKKMHNQFNEVIIKMKGRMETLEKEGDFFKNNDECPSCSQVITEDTKASILSKNTEQSNKYSEAVLQAQSKLDEISKTLDKVQELETLVQTNQNQIQLKQYEINNLNKSIAGYESKLIKLTNDSSSIDKEKAKIETLTEEMSALTGRQEELLNLMHEHTIIVDLLKDSGIKTQIVRKYLPVMNKSIRKYLTALDFPILFQLDEEFNETVASPAYQDFSYASFSEGQKSRIDLALLFTWREIGQMKNSVSTNLLILDEVFSSSLDEVGKQNLLALLRYSLTDTNVVVIDHTLSQEFQDKFDNTLEVTKQKGFSQYTNK